MAHMTLKEEFTLKCKSLKLWTPVHDVSNRDRLELFGLHKQAVEGDCTADPTKLVGSEKQKVREARGVGWNSTGEEDLLFHSR